MILDVSDRGREEALEHGARGVDQLAVGGEDRGVLEEGLGLAEGVRRVRR
ncbi:hypothetical protein [Demequina rhizosphaerae]|nr:hypothetical protein [Demequina rhizosphaerae]